MKKLCLVFCPIAFAIATPAFAQEERAAGTSERQDRRERPSSDWRLHLISGFSYGQRDSEDGPATNYYRLPLSARVSNGPFRLTASMPYLMVDGPASIAGDGDDVEDIDDLPTTRSGDRRGFGDLRLTGRYRLPRSALGGFELDLLGRVKLPTASRAKRLGTGETDFAVGAELSRDIGKLEPFVSAQYRINGDRPDYDYKNTVATSLGTGIQLARRTRASIAYDFSQSRIRGREGFHSLDLGLSRRLSRRLLLSGAGSIGLSERAPDFTVGSTISYRAF